MTTLSIKKLEAAVCGFIKEIQLSIESPDVIKDLIVEFAKFWFNWRHSKYLENHYKFNDEDPTRIIRTSSENSFLAMDDVLSLTVCKKFVWELELIKQMNRTSLQFAFGVVEHPRDESIKRWDHYYSQDSNTVERQYGIYVSSALRKDVKNMDRMI